MHSGFGAAPRTIQLLHKGLSHALPLAFGSMDRYHHPPKPSRLVAGTHKGCNLPTASPIPGGRRISPEALLLIYKLGQHGVRTAVKVQRLPDPRERKNSPRDTQSHVLIFFFFFFKNSKKIRCLKKKGQFILTCCQRKQIVKMACELRHPTSVNSPSGLKTSLQSLLLL